MGNIFIPIVADICQGIGDLEKRKVAFYYPMGPGLHK